MKISRLYSKKVIDTDTGEEIASNYLIDRIIQNPKIFGQNGDKFLSGVLQTPSGPLLYSSHSILTSVGSGPSRGTVIFGRLMNQNEIDRLSKITHVPVELIPYDINNQKTQIAKKNLTTTSKYAVVPISTEEIDGYATINDYSGKPIYLIHVTLPRTLYQQGTYTLGYLMKIALFFSVASVLILVFALNRFIFSRFVKLTKNPRKYLPRMTCLLR